MLLMGLLAAGISLAVCSLVTASWIARLDLWFQRLRILAVLTLRITWGVP